MKETAFLATNRLLLRPWTSQDLEPFVQLNADPRVMKHFPQVKNAQETKSEYQRILDHFQEHGWGLWAVSLQKGPPFIGFIGLRYDNFPAPFTPAVEVGWRLAYEYWGKGYATEGALASLRFGFETLQLPEILSFTAVQNALSRRVMEKIGMHRDPKDDFDHPKLPEGHRLRRHVLYRLSRKQWEELHRHEKICQKNEFPTKDCGNDGKLRQPYLQAEALPILGPMPSNSLSVHRRVAPQTFQEARF